MISANSSRESIASENLTNRRGTLQFDVSIAKLCKALIGIRVHNSLIWSRLCLIIKTVPTLASGVLYESNKKSLQTRGAYICAHPEHIPMKKPSTLNSIGAAILTAAVLSLAGTVRAENLNTSFAAEPFLDTALGGTTAAARPELAGLIIEDVLTPFSIPSQNVSGTVQNRVVRETGTGTLDFYWRILVDSNSTGAGVSSLRIGDFGFDFLTDADWRLDGLGSVAPDIGRVFNPATAPEGFMNFVFSDPIPAGSESYFFFLHTDATAYAKTAMYDLTLSGTAGISESYSTFAPANPVPDGGSSLALLSLGLLSLGAWARRR